MNLFFSRSRVAGPQNFKSNDLKLSVQFRIRKVFF